jgi:hypothetical protein
MVNIALASIVSAANGQIEADNLWESQVRYVGLCQLLKIALGLGDDEKKEVIGEITEHLCHSLGDLDADRLFLLGKVLKTLGALPQDIQAAHPESRARPAITLVLRGYAG